MSELAELVIKSCTILACRPGMADQLIVLSATPAAAGGSGGGSRGGEQRGRRAAGAASGGAAVGVSVALPGN